MKYKYTEAHKKRGIGKEYDNELYGSDGWSSRIWELEKYILKKELRNKSLKVMDFAAGTGRISKYLEFLGLENILAVDTSKFMLEEARKKLKFTKFFCGDILKIHLKFQEKFNLITSFRFFLNVDKSLKIPIMKKLSEFIKDDGQIIFNIHANKRSIFFFRNLFLKKSNSMSLKEIKSILKESGLKIEKIYSYGFIPHWKKRKIFSFRIWFFLEKLLISKFNLFGTHLMFFCRKKNE